MKNIIKTLVTLVLAGIAANSCDSMLDVTDPNYFDDETINKYIINGTDSTKKEKVLGGMATGLNSTVRYKTSVLGAMLNQAYYFEQTQEKKRSMQAGDIVEGTSSHAGFYTEFYNNSDAIIYWDEQNAVDCIGYYWGPVYRIGAARQLLSYLKDDAAVTKDPLLRGYRAKALTMKAYGYMQLMERWTDLQDVTSTTKQGWPIYNEYAREEPKAPSSVADTWAWIKGALDTAVVDYKNSSYGNKGYTIPTGIENLVNFTDVDLSFTQYVRARVALDMKDWSTAIDAATDLLAQYPGFIAPENYGMPASYVPSIARIEDNSGKVVSWGTYNASKNAFFNLDLNPEAIFGGSRGDGTTQDNTAPFWEFNPIGHKSVDYFGIHNGWSSMQLDKNIYDKLDDRDVRKSLVLRDQYDNFRIINSVQGTDTTWSDEFLPAYTYLKWAATEGIGVDAHSVTSCMADDIYIRSSSVWLMLAEAYAQSGNDAKAKETLDKLLAARTLPGEETMTCDNTMQGMSTLDMVKLQWRIEMWGEGDWAFFNQKRWGSFFDRGSNHWSMAKPSHSTWEIPRPERQGNPYWD